MCDIRDLFVGYNCDEGTSFSFATLYSDLINQTMEVDSFSYALSIDGTEWDYYLELSTDSIVITNDSYNSNEKLALFGGETNSDVIIKNLSLTNFKSAIRFSVPTFR